MADAPEVQIAVLKTEVAALTRQVEKLTAAVENLTAIMNRGKGAFAASLALAGAVGAFVMKVVTYLFSLGHSGS